MHEAEASGSMWVIGQLTYQFYNNQVYIARPCLKTNKQTNEKTVVETVENQFVKRIILFSGTSKSQSFPIA